MCANGLLIAPAQKREGWSIASLSARQEALKSFFRRTFGLGIAMEVGEATLEE